MNERGSFVRLTKERQAGRQAGRSEAWLGNEYSGGREKKGGSSNMKACVL